MINLLKKDIRACVQTDIKILIKLLIGIMIFSSVLAPFSVVGIPLFISYIFISRSFYLDELNKCDYFFNSLPIDKEDVVYSRYIFATIIIISSLVITYLYSKFIGNIWLTDMILIETVLTVLSLLLILLSILMPIMFRYGYSKSYIAVNLIMGIIVIASIVVSFQSQSIVVIHSTDGGPNLLYNNTKYFIATGVSFIIFLASMFISTKLYTKKEIAH